MLIKLFTVRLKFYQHSLKLVFQSGRTEQPWQQSRFQCGLQATASRRKSVCGVIRMSHTVCVITLTARGGVQKFRTAGLMPRMIISPSICFYL